MAMSEVAKSKDLEGNHTGADTRFFSTAAGQLQLLENAKVSVNQDGRVALYLEDGRIKEFAGLADMLEAVGIGGTPADIAARWLSERLAAGAGTFQTSLGEMLVAVHGDAAFSPASGHMRSAESEQGSLGARSGLTGEQETAEQIGSNGRFNTPFDPGELDGSRDGANALGSEELKFALGGYEIEPIGEGLDHAPPLGNDDFRFGLTGDAETVGIGDDRGGPGGEDNDPDSGSSAGADMTNTIASQDDSGPPPPAPVTAAQDDLGGVVEDNVLTGAWLANDTVVGGVGGVSITSGPANGTATINSAGNYTYTPDPDFFGTDSFVYEVTDASGKTSSATITITVDPVDEPVAAANDTGSGGEDAAINGNWFANDSVPDRVQTVTVTGAAANGTVVINTDGTYAYTPNANYFGNDSFTYEVTDTDGDTATATVNLTVTPVDEPVTATDDTIGGGEDTAIGGNWLANDSVPDGVQAVTVTVAAANGTAVINTDGTFTYSPAADFNGTDSFTYQVTDTDGDTASATITVTVAPQDDAIAATDDTGSGAEDNAINGNWLANDSVPDGVQSVTITAGPSNGAAVVNVNGTYTYTPAADFSGADGFTYEVTDADGNTTATATINLTVTPVADQPTVTTAAAAGNEDTAIPLSISAAPADPSESILEPVVIANVPAGAALSAGADQGGGVWHLTVAQLTGLTVTPPADSNADFTLQVTATSQESDGSTAQTSSSLAVTVTGVADAPTIQADNVSGNEDTNIALSLAGSLNDTDGSETLTARISGMPAGWTLTSGADQGGGIWTVPVGDLGGLQVTPAQHFSGSANLTLELVVTEDDGDTNVVTDPFTVTVAPLADAPAVTTGAASGTEDSVIALDITVALVDSSETLVEPFVISNVPAGAALSAGADQGGGVWHVTAAQLTGLTITPPGDSNDDFTLQVTATSQESDGGTAQTTTPLAVTVTGDADAPTIQADSVSGNEDTAIALTLSGALNDIDGSETLTARILGVPTGATLSSGSNQGGGVWTVAPGDLGALTITPPANFSGDINLTLELTATEDDGDTNVVTDPFTVTVIPVADGPSVTTQAASGNEDAAIPLSITIGLPDVSETILDPVVLSNVPAGATLSAGADQGGGVWHVTQAQLAGLTITPLQHSNVDFTIQVTATTQESDGSTAQTTMPLAVTLTGVADAPTILANDVTANEDTTVDLDLSGALVDTDGSETLTATISGVPAGGAIVGGTDQGGGVWSIDPANLGSAQMTLPQHFNADLNGVIGMTLTLTTTEDDGDTATVSDPFTVTITPVDDPVSASNDTATTDEDMAVTGSWLANDSVPDGVQSVTVTAAASNGSVVINTDGTYTYTPNANFSGTDQFSYQVTDGQNGDTASATVAITVDPVAGDATVTTAPASGNEDAGAIVLSISTALTDTDGSEAILDPVVISGVPSGATLSAGSNQGGGVWNVTQAELAGLTITPPSDSNVDFTLTVTVTTQESDGSTDTVIETLAVDLTGVADTPGVTAGNVSGNEDASIPLSISGSLADTDGSETLTYTIGNVPAGGTFSAGTNNGDGTWTIAAGDIGGLTFRAPSHQAGTFNMTVTATATENDGDIATASDNFSVTVAAVADAPTVTSNASGNEDTAIALNLSVALADTDGSETLQEPIIISGVPAGASLSAGADQGGGVWQLTIAQLSGLTISPPADSNVNFDLTLQATSQDSNGDTATSNETVTVSITGVADTPSASAANASGVEDNAIALNLTGTLADTDGSEILTATVTGVPAGAVFSAGTNAGGGTWTFAAGDLAGLTVTPPEHFSGTMNLTFTVTATEDDGDTATASDTFDVSVTPDADAPALIVRDAQGNEDTAIPLDIRPTLVDADGSETLSIRITGVPAGATLSAGTDQGGGIYTLTPAQLTGLAITPPADSNVNFSLTVEVTSTETVGGDAETTAGTINVSVTGVADTPTLTGNNITVEEDNQVDIGSNVSGALTDTDGSETLYYVLTGLPSGVTPSVGTFSGGDKWTIQGADIGNLTFQPPQNFTGTINLTLTAVAQENDGDTATNPLAIDVTVTSSTSAAPVVDGPVASWPGSVAGTEDTDINVDLTPALIDNDGSETVTAIVVSGLPAGAALTGSGVTDNGDGTFNVDPNDATVTFTPPDDSNVNFSVNVSATVAEADGGTQSFARTLGVSLTGDADAPTFAANDVATTVDVPATLDIAGSLNDTDGSETLHYIVSGVPAGALLSAGFNNGDGTWTLSAGQVAGLQLTPPASFTGAISLTATAVVTENDGDRLTAPDTFTVTINAGGPGGPSSNPGDPGDNTDPGPGTLPGSVGNEDAALALDLSSLDNAGTDTVDITGVPAGAGFSAGTDNGGGSWSFTRAQLSGLTLTPPAHDAGDFQLAVTTNLTAGGTQNDTLTVNVTPVPDAPTLVINTVSGIEDAAIALDITAALVDTDGSETLSIVISDLPPGAVLSAGTFNPVSDSWTINPSDLAGLTITPPNDASGDITLTVTAVATESNGTFATSSGSAAVQLTPVADGPTGLNGSAAGNEDTAIAVSLNVGTGDGDGSETVTEIVLSGLPAGAGLAGPGITDNGDGTYDVDPGNQGGITVTPPANSDADFTISVQATTTETANGNQTTGNGTIDVAVTGVADQAVLTTQNTTGNEDAAIALPGLSAALADTDGSEVISVIVSGVPDNSIFSAGSNNGDGTWSFTPAQLTGLSITPPPDFGGDMNLTLTAFSLESSGDLATASSSFTVTVTPAADAPILNTFSASGTEDQNVSLNITASSDDDDGSETLEIRISGMPAGSSLTAGTNLGGGIWSLTMAQLVGLALIPAAHASGTFALTVEAIASESNGSTASASLPLEVTLDPVADAPVVTAGNVSGDQDTSISLDLQAALADTDGSEFLTISIAGVPNGAALSAGTDQGGGVWSINPGDLAGLTVTPPTGSVADFTLTVTATANESDGSTEDTVSNIGVVVNQVFTGTNGNDTLTGTGDSDSLYGLNGNDVLDGGLGADNLIGGIGSDTLTGGGGIDIFRYDGGELGNGTDTVTDFTIGAGGDVLSIGDLLAGFDAQTSAAAEFVQLFDDGVDTTVRVDSDGTANGVSFQELGTLEGVTGVDLDTLLSDGNIALG